MVEKKYPDFIEKLSTGAYALDGDRIVFANSALALLLGYPHANEIMGKSFGSLVHPDDHILFAQSDKNNDPKTYELKSLTFRMICKNGSTIWVSGHHPQRYSGDNPDDFGCLVDITDLKNREDSLSESEQNYRIVLNEIEDGYLEYDLAGNAVFCNDAVCNIFGVSREWLLGKNYRDSVDEETANACYQAFNRVYLTGIPRKSFIFATATKGGVRKILEYSISLKKDKRGEAIGFRSIVRDITERKRAEADILEHRSRLRAIFRSVKDAIITVDTDLRVIEANQAAQTICGFDSKAIIDSVFTEVPSHCGNSCHEVLLETLKRKTTVTGYQAECQHRLRSSQKVDLSSSPLLDKTGKFMGAVLVIRDITRLNELEQELKERHSYQKLIGKSSRMREIYKLLEDLADLETTVLITGESGTGKEMVAKALHNSGKRAFKPFVTVNCSALAENLLESELFGHVKGAFTGAVKNALGRFQTANGGTILLDEIGDISPRIQLKLLRVLQEKTFERVGDPTPIQADVRIIACTNKNLKTMVHAGNFREDLYYRLKVVEIGLPPLRKRRGDIPLLVDHFRVLFNRTFNKNIQSISNPVLDAFMAYSWPGNVRELEHTVEHAFVLCHGDRIEVNHLPVELRSVTPIPKPAALNKPVAGREEVEKALSKTDWNVAKAARLLSIGRRTIYRRIEAFGLVRPREKT
jgi:PAS domain S-box-containing protein